MSILADTNILPRRTLTSNRSVTAGLEAAQKRADCQSAAD